VRASARRLASRRFNRVNATTDNKAIMGSKSLSEYWHRHKS
jgi:hypothetical protein